MIEFQRMNFNDISSIANYGQEILEEARIQNNNDQNLINVNMQDEELKDLIASIPLSIDEEIDKNSNDGIPVVLNVLDKILNVKPINFLEKIFFKNKLSDKIEERKNNDEHNNSVFLYQTIMTNIDNIRFKLEDEYTVLEETIKTLNISKSTLGTLLENLNYVISEGEKDIEKYKNSNIEDNLKKQKLEIAKRQILSLKKSKVTIEGFIQAKDVSAMNIYMHAMNVKDWLQNNYVLLSHGVETAIESKYISNKVNLMNEINETSNKVITGSAERLKESTNKNIQMLKDGSLNINTINTYLKTVNEALLPIKGYIENKETITKKLSGDIDKIQSEINKNYEVIESIGEHYLAPSIGESKQLKLGQKTYKND